MNFSGRRVGAIVRKELRDYRRNRFVIFTMSALPLLFIVMTMIQLFALKATISSARLNDRIGLSMLYMLLIPTMVPSALTAYSVVGEREQGTLEPILITPITREEFLVGKALAAFAPTIVIAYVLFGVFLGAAELFAHPVVISAIFERSHVLIQLLFTPLLAGWAIWMGPFGKLRWSVGKVNSLRQHRRALAIVRSDVPRYRERHSRHLHLIECLG